MKGANTRGKAAIAIAILLTLLVVGIAYAATVNIDSFDDDAQNLEVLSGTTTDYDVVDATGLLAGERDAVLQWTSGGRINLDVDLDGTANKFSYTGGDNAIGWATITWDGDDGDATTLDNDGLNSVDLTGSGTNDAIMARIINADLRSRLTIQVYADTAGLNWSYSTANLPPLNPGTRMDVLFPFTGFTTGGGTGATFASVGAVVMRLDGDVDASVDVSIDFVEASSVREYGDLPVGTYGENMLSASHVPHGLRLGPNCDAEATYNSSTDALGDDNDQAAPDDEDGVWPTFIFGRWCAGAGPGGFGCGWVYVSPKGCANLGGCYVNGWIDWNNNGILGDTVDGASEHIISNVNLTADADALRGFSTPTTFSNGNYYARFRICRTNTACDDPDNTDTDVLDGEVEDYRWYVGPTAVELASFTATPQAWTKSILLEWETISEVDNLGFNLYRAESPDGRQIRLNANLIPSQGPGSPIGFKYSFADRTARPGRTYYYWLEAVDIYGMTASYGPVAAAIPLQIGVPKPRTP